MSELTLKILDSIEGVIRKKNHKEIVPLHEPYFEDTNELYATSWHARSFSPDSHFT